MKHKIIIFVMSVFFITGSLFGYSLYVEPTYKDGTTLNINDTFTIDIKFDAGESGAWAAVTLLKWDSSVLSFENHTNNISAWSNSAPVKNSNQLYPSCDTAAGIFFWDYSGFTSYTNVQTVHTITFKVKSKKNTVFDLIMGEVISGGYSGSGLFSDVPLGQFLPNVTGIDGYITLETDNAPPIISNYKIENLVLKHADVSGSPIISDSSISSNFTTSMFLGKSDTQINQPINIWTTDTGALSRAYHYTLSGDSLTTTGIYWLKIIAIDNRGNSTTVSDSFEIIDWPISITKPGSKKFDTSSISVTFSGTSEADSILIKSMITQISVSNPASFSEIINLYSNQSNTIVITAYKYSLSRPVYTDTYIIYCDALAPIITNFKINNGAFYTNDTSVILTFSAVDTGVGIASIRFNEDTLPSGIWESYTTSKTFFLSNKQGTKKVYVQCKDNIGNISTADTTIYLDYTPPSGTLQIGSSDWTNGIDNYVYYTYTDSTPMVKVSIDNSSNVEESSKGDTVSNPVLVKLTSSDGLKIIYLRIYDSAGNYATLTDTISLDRTVPLYYNEGYTFLNPETADSVALKISGQDGAGAGLNTNSVYASLKFSIDSSKNNSNIKLNYSNGYFTTNYAVSALSNNQICTVTITGQDIVGNTGALTYTIRIQNATNLSVNLLTGFVDTSSRTINSRIASFNISLGNDNDTNSLYRYNSETKDTITLINNKKLHTFTDTITFTKDGVKTVIYTGATMNDILPRSYFETTFKIDGTPPVLKIRYPLENQYCMSDTIIGMLDHNSGDTLVPKDTAKIYIDDAYLATANLYVNDDRYFSYNFGQLTAQTHKLVVIASDYAGNISAETVYFYYQPTTDTIIMRTLNDTAPIDSNVAIVYFPLNKSTDLISGIAPDTFTMPYMKMTNAGTMNISINFSDTSTPLDLIVKTGNDPNVVNITKVATLTKLGSISDSNLYASTIREFQLLRNGDTYNAETDTYIKEIKIIYELPKSITNQNLSIFTLIKDEWKDLRDISGNTVAVYEDTIVAFIPHFSFYAILPATLLAEKSLNNVIVFPNPFIPNDNLDNNGVEYDKNPTLGGIHIKGLTQECKIEIYTLLGELVDEISKNDNNGMYIWDAKNKNGDKVASGIYFIVIKGAGQKVVKKVAIIR